MKLSEDKQALRWSQVSADFKEVNDRLKQQIELSTAQFGLLECLEERVAALEAACEYCLHKEDDP